jgi:hypothetical protein
MCVCVKHSYHHSCSTLYIKHKVSRTSSKIRTWALTDKARNGFVLKYGKNCLWTRRNNLLWNATSKNSRAAAECINKPIHVSPITSLAPETINSDLMTQITMSRRLDACSSTSNILSVPIPPTGLLGGPLQCHEIHLHG